jgi:Arylsulfotransferase (ASST)
MRAERVIQMKCLDSANLSTTSRRRSKNPGLFVALALVLAAFLALLAPAGAVGSLGTASPWGEGVKVYKPGQCCDGYTVFTAGFFAPSNARLLDMNGGKVREWAPAGGCGYLTKPLPGGSILCFGGSISQTGDFTDLLQLNWNGDVTWRFNNWANIGGVPSAEAHHDFQREGNPVGYYAPGMEPMATGGKTLVLAHTTAINTAISWWPLKDPVIYEIDADGKPTGFEWHGIDHFDEYGFNDAARWMIMWFGGFFGDYLHMNSMSTLGPNQWYDSGDARFKPDNIITSSRSANLITIIDRQTGHIVYKVGPDYSSSTPEGQKLGQIIGQHHAHMIPRGLPGEGHILLFDNGGLAGYPIAVRGYSRVIEFNPVTLEKVWEYEDQSGSIFIPYGEDRMFFSYFISGAQRLPNGNTLITEGSVGRLIEVTPRNEVVWEYSMWGEGPIYRAYRVPPEWVPGNPNGYANWGSLSPR